MKILFDEYELKARVAPGLILAFPLLADAAYVAPSLSGWPIFASGSLVSLALLYGLTFVVRGLGEDMEPQLWANWGGPPSTRIMRHRDSTLTADLKASISRALSTEFGSRLMTREEEASNQVASDKAIADAFRQVREYLRQHNPDGLWFKHNIEYGFCRNLLACRVPWALLALAGTILAAIYSLKVSGSILNPASVIGCLVFLCAVAVGWAVLPGTTKRVADGYAEAAWMAFLRLSQQSQAKATSVSSSGGKKNGV
jgi:hypothetical protein